MKKLLASLFAAAALCGWLIAPAPAAVTAIPCDQLPALTGAVTSTAGTCATVGGTTVVRVKVQKFLAGGTYTPSAGLLYAIIECHGGGGAGGGVAGAAGDIFIGGGGASGSYSRAYVSAATVGASQTVTIGAGGTAGAVGANNGGAGADTSVGTLCVGKGGSGGAFTNGAQLGLGGAAGVAGTGDLNLPGNNGPPGFYALITTIIPSAGAGANSHFSGGGQPLAGTGTGTSAAANTGAGGAGGYVNNAATNVAGGGGGSGIVVITEFTNQ